MTANDTQSLLVFENLIDNIPHSIFWKDPQLKFAGCNRQFAVDAGFSSVEEIIGKTDLDLPFPHELAEKYRTDDLTILKTRIPKLNYEENYMSTTNSPHTMLVSKVPIFDREIQEVKGILGIYTDITHLKELEAAKRESELSRHTISQLKMIASSIFHEVRTPLAGVKLGLTFLRDHIKKLVTERLTLEQIPQIQQNLQVSSTELAEQIKYINKLIKRIDEGNDLLVLQLKNMTIERIDNRNFSMHNITEGIEEAVSTFPFKYAQEKELIQVNISQPFAYWGDHLLTKHMIWNLLNNAFHFIREEGKGEIFITTRQTASYYLLEMKDTALGITEEQISEIFKPFYSHQTGGSGLGLSFCTMVMEAFGGKITCEGEAGQYTKFTAHFPKKIPKPAYTSDQHDV